MPVLSRSSVVIVVLLALVATALSQRVGSLRPADAIALQSFCEGINPRPINWDCASAGAAGTAGPVGTAWTGITIQCPMDVAGGCFVAYIELSDLSLGGSLGPFIGNFTGITDFFLDSTGISGSIPSSICSLTTLNFLVLNGNPSVVGSIPDCIGAMTALEELDLGNTRVTGTIPVSLATISGFYSLVLTNTDVSGPVPDFSTTQLDNFRVSNTCLYGELNSTIVFGSTACDITNTSICTTSLSCGSTAAFSCEPFKSECPIPDLGRLHETDRVALQALCDSLSTVPPSWNCSNVNGTIAEGGPCTWGVLTVECSPTFIGNLFAHVVYLALDYLDATGTIPKEIRNLTSLTYLSLRNNKITGSIPVEVYGLESLRSLILENNNLTGGLSNDICNLDQLDLLNLDVNPSFGGTIPDCLGLVPNLRALYLGNLNLSGTIPSTFSMALDLGILSVRNNSLSGSIPDLSLLNSLRYLYLSDNPCLEGTLATNFTYGGKSQCFATRSSICVGVTLCNFESETFCGNLPAFCYPAPTPVPTPVPTVFSPSETPSPSIVVAPSSSGSPSDSSNSPSDSSNSPSDSSISPSNSSSTASPSSVSSTISDSPSIESSTVSPSIIVSVNSPSSDIMMESPSVVSSADVPSIAVNEPSSVDAPSVVSVNSPTSGSVSVNSPSTIIAVSPSTKITAPVPTAVSSGSFSVPLSIVSLVALGIILM